MRWIKFAALAGSVLLGSAAHASNTDWGYISWVYAVQGKAFVKVTGTRTGTIPSCATIPAEWAFDASTAAGQSMLATVLTAYSLHKQVIVQGTSTSCNAWGDREDMNLVLSGD